MYEDRHIGKACCHVCQHDIVSFYQAAEGKREQVNQLKKS